jgi:hypothetical protein
LPSFFFDAGCAAAWEAEPFCCTAGGRFELDIVVPKNYPLRPPKIHFITKIFHPNIHFKTGEICLDLVCSSFTLRDEGCLDIVVLTHAACSVLTTAQERLVGRVHPAVRVPIHHRPPLAPRARLAPQLRLW